MAHLGSPRLVTFKFFFGRLPNLDKTVSTGCEVDFVNIYRRDLGGGLLMRFVEIPVSTAPLRYWPANE